MNSDYQISELTRQLSNIVRLGVVREINHKTQKVRVQTGGILTNWLSWLSSRAGSLRSWSSPSINEQVVILSPQGELSQAIVLPAIYQNQYPAPSNEPNEHCLVFADGSKISYNDATLAFKIQIGSSSITVTKDGIKLNAQRIDLN